VGISRYPGTKKIRTKKAVSNHRLFLFNEPLRSKLTWYLAIDVPLPAMGGDQGEGDGPTFLYFTLTSSPIKERNL
jgi:hypothetical protein